MRAGPKRQIDAPPLDLSALPASGGARVVAFVEEFCRLPKGRGARSPISLRPWQRDLVHGLFAAPRPRQALITMGRKNGKTLLASCLALYALFADGEEGGEIIIVSSDERTARVTFNLARRMVELEPRLAEQVQIFQDRIYYPSTDSVIEPLPADGARLQGRNPSLVVADEVHVMQEEVWDAMALAGAARERPLILGLSTAGDDPDSILSRLTDYGRDNPDDPAFYFREFTAPVLDDHLDESTWLAANPGLDDFVSREHLRATAKTTRPDVFRRFHLNQAVGAVGAWMPFGAFEQCADRDRIVLPGEKIVAGWDGSLGGDTSCIIGCTVEERPHLFVIGWWEREIERKKDPDWRVPRKEVNEAVASMFEVYDVVEMACDPFFWWAEIQRWSELWPGKVLQWPTNQPRRTAPGTERLFVATMERTFTHDGDPRLIAHARNAKARRTSHGDVLNKRSESKRIDGIIASLVAFDRAAFHRSKAQRRRGIYAF